MAVMFRAGGRAVRLSNRRMARDGLFRVRSAAGHETVCILNLFRCVDGRCYMLFTFYADADEVLRCAEYTDTDGTVTLHPLDGAGMAVVGTLIENLREEGQTVSPYRTVEEPLTAAVTAPYLIRSFLSHRSRADKAAAVLDKLLTGTESLPWAVYALAALIWVGLLSVVAGGVMFRTGYELFGLYIDSATAARVFYAWALPTVLGGILLSKNVRSYTTALETAFIPFALHWLWMTGVWAPLMGRICWGALAAATVIALTVILIKRKTAEPGDQNVFEKLRQTVFYALGLLFVGTVLPFVAFSPSGLFHTPL